MTITAIGEATRLDSTRALVISASEENRAALSEALAADSFEPVLCSSMTDARKFIESDDIGIVFCDDCLSDGCLKNVVAEARERQKPVPVIAVSRTGEWHEYFEALRAGAFDYLSLPLKRDELDRVLVSALSKKRPISRAKAKVAI